MLRLAKKMERAEKEALEGKTTPSKESAGDSKKKQ